MGSRRRKPFQYGLALILLIVVVTSAVARIPTNYINRQADALRQVFSKNGASINEQNFPNPCWFKRFPDGSWIVAESASIAGGDLFDATVVMDSTGRVFSSRHSFSGVEGLGEDFGRLNASNASEITAKFGSLGFGYIDM